MLVGWFAEWRRGRRRRCGGRSRVRSRVSVPAVTPVQPELLDAVRSVRRDLDYYVQRNGRVLLLAWDMNKPRVHEGRKMLEVNKRFGWMASLDELLLVEGFSILADLPNDALWSGELRFAAEYCVRRSMRDAEELHRERLRAADDTLRDERHEAVMRDRIRSEYRSDHAILFRKRQSFGYDARLAAALARSPAVPVGQRRVDPTGEYVFSKTLST